MNELTKAEKCNIIKMWEDNDITAFEISEKLKLEDWQVEAVIASYYRKKNRELRTEKKVPVHQQGFSLWVDEILFQTWYNMKKI